MWVATNFGFFSVVCRPPTTVDHGDERTLQVRARTTRHLANLRSWLGDENRPIIQLKCTDYEFRLYVTPDEWVRVLARVTYDINYVNFKNTVKDDKLHDLYLRIWGAVAATYSHRDKFTRRGKR
jgi:hypothetical protein